MLPHKDLLNAKNGIQLGVLSPDVLHPLHPKVTCCQRAQVAREAGGTPGGRVHSGLAGFCLFKRNRAGDRLASTWQGIVPRHPRARAALGTNRAGPHRPEEGRVPAVPRPRGKDPHGSWWLQRPVLVKHNNKKQAFPRSLKATAASCAAQGCQGASNRDEL